MLKEDAGVKIPCWNDIWGIIWYYQQIGERTAICEGYYTWADLTGANTQGVSFDSCNTYGTKF